MQIKVLHEPCWNACMSHRKRCFFLQPVYTEQNLMVGMQTVDSDAYYQSECTILSHWINKLPLSVQLLRCEEGDTHYFSADFLKLWTLDIFQVVLPGKKLKQSPYIEIISSRGLPYTHIIYYSTLGTTQLVFNASTQTFVSIAYDVKIFTLKNRKVKSTL